jgi:hypothetical protein
MAIIFLLNAGLQEDDGGSGKIEASLVFFAIPL